MKMTLFALLIFTFSFEIQAARLNLRPLQPSIPTSSEKNDYSNVNIANRALQILALANDESVRNYQYAFGSATSVIKFLMDIGRMRSASDQDLAYCDGTYAFAILDPKSHGLSNIPGELEIFGVCDPAIQLGLDASAYALIWAAGVRLTADECEASRLAYEAFKATQTEMTFVDSNNERCGFGQTQSKQI